MPICLKEYLKDPCGSLSIPWWKHQRIRVPTDMQILHQRDFAPELLAEYEDEPYFRLMHNLADIGAALPDWLLIRRAERADIPRLVEIINASYTDLSVDAAQLEGYTQTPVYAPELWLMALDRRTGWPVGCGIADLDREAGEGMLEWIQVLPEYRRQHVGSALVNQLLRRMQGQAAFATVSGRVENHSRPEALYRACGFTGQDVWHVLRRKPLRQPKG